MKNQMARIDYYFATLSPYCLNLAGNPAGRKWQANMGATRFAYKPFDIVAGICTHRRSYAEGPSPPAVWKYVRRSCRVQARSLGMPFNLSRRQIGPPTARLRPTRFIAAQECGRRDLGGCWRMLITRACMGRGKRPWRKEECDSACPDGAGL